MLSLSPNIIGELAAVLGAGYQSFLHARLERRHGRRGKVHARDVGTAVEMAAEMIGEAADGHDADVLWLMAFAELDRDRGGIEADALAHHGYVVPEHEWRAFLEWVGQVRARDLRDEGQT